MKNSYIILLCIVIIWIGTSCTKDVSGSEVTNEKVISLIGNVYDNSGKGVPNITVELTELGFTDVTDINGLYSIEVTSDSLTALGKSIDGIVDTLHVQQYENIIRSFTIAEFIDTLPDTYIVQRNIWGGLKTTVTSITKVEAVVTVKNEAMNLTKEIELWLNKASNNFSGFLYMLQSFQNSTYDVYVQAYDSLGHISGKSETITFNDMAGDIDIPPFDPFNAVPGLTIVGPTEAKINTPVELWAKAEDNFGGYVPYFRWEFDDGTVDTTNVVTHIFKEEKLSTVTVTIMDTDQNTVTKTYDINITNEGPTITELPDTIVTINDTVTYSVTASDENGIAKILWDFGEGDVNRPQFDSTLNSPTSTVSHVYPAVAEVGSVLPLTVMAIDSFGAITVDTILVTLIQGIPSVSIDAFDSAKINTSVLFKAIGKDSLERAIVSYEWNFGDGTIGHGPIVNHTFLEERVFSVTLKATDDDNNSVTSVHDINIINEGPTITELPDTIVTINDTVTYSVTASDENGIAKILWDFGEGDVNRPQFDSTLNSPTSTVSHVYPAVAEVGSVLPLTVMAIDSFGDTTTQTAAVTFIAGLPIITPQGDTLVASDATVEVTVNAVDTDIMGGINRYLWDLDNDGIWDVEGKTQGISKPLSGTYPIIWGAEDNDGNIVADTFDIYFNSAPYDLTFSDTVWGRDTFALHWSAMDVNFPYDTLKYEVWIGANENDLNLIYSGKSDYCILSELVIGAPLFYKLVVSDLFGTETIQEGTFVSAYNRWENIEVQVIDSFMDIHFWQNKLWFTGFSSVNRSSLWGAIDDKQHVNIEKDLGYYLLLQLQSAKDELVYYKNQYAGLYDMNDYIVSYNYNKKSETILFHREVWSKNPWLPPLIHSISTNGAKWFHSNNVLYKFDNAKFVVEQDSLSYGVLGIKSIDNSEVWLACTLNRLVNYKSGVFTEYTSSTGQNSVHFSFLEITENRYVWTAGDNGGGIFCFDNGNWTNYTTSNSNLPSDTIYDFSSYENTLYAATANGVAAIKDGGITVFKPTDPSITTASMKKIAVQDNTTAYTINHDNQLLKLTLE